LCTDYRGKEKEKKRKAEPRQQIVGGETKKGGLTSIANLGTVTDANLLKAAHRHEKGKRERKKTKILRPG